MTTLADLVRSGDLEFSDGYRTKSSELAPEGFRIVRAGDIRDGIMFLDGPDFVAPERGSFVGEKTVRAGDVVLTTKGTVGRTAIVAEVTESAVYSPQICYFRFPSGSAIDSSYFYYWLQSLEFKRQAGYLKESSDMAPYISLRDLGNVEISIPSSKVQRGIREVLGALDERVVTNNNIQATVDDICQAKFSQIACGADMVTLGEKAVVNARTVNRVSGGVLRYIDISCVGVGRYDWPIEIPWSVAPGRARRGLGKGDTIWSMVRPNRRSHAMIMDGDAGLVGSTGLVVLTSSEGRPAYLYQATKTDKFIDYLVASADGSAYPAVKADKFLNAPFPVAPNSLADKFESFAYPLRECAHAAVVESRILAALRDTLLPALMSGRLSVRQAEDMVSEVV